MEGGRRASRNKKKGCDGKKDKESRGRTADGHLRTRRKDTGRSKIKAILWVYFEPSQFAHVHRILHHLLDGDLTCLDSAFHAVTLVHSTYPLCSPSALNELAAIHS